MCDKLFIFNNTATTEIYTLSLHDALPIWRTRGERRAARAARGRPAARCRRRSCTGSAGSGTLRRSSPARSEEHKSELQSRQILACRLLLEKQNIESKCPFVSSCAAQHIDV